MDFYYLEEHNLLIFLIQLFVLLTCAKLLGKVFEKYRQPTIAADLLVGIFFGPTILGRVFPAFQRLLFPKDLTQYNMLDTMGWLGIFFLLLIIGMEVNFTSIWKQKGSAVKISMCDVFIPILISGVFLWFLPDRYLINPEYRLLFTIFVATIMTISAMTVTIRVMQDLKILKTDLGFLIVSVLSFNDIIGWLIFTIVLGLFLHSEPNLLKVVTIVSATLIFALFSLTIGKRIVAKILRNVNKNETNTGASLTVVSLLGMLFGAITTKIGIHALFGFFIAGLISGESKDLSQRTRQIIHYMVYSIFVPIFFINIGLKVDFFSNLDILLIIFILLIGTFARYSAAWIGSKISGVGKGNRNIVSIAHTPGGEMHVVVGMLALEAGLLNEVMFVAIVFSAVFSAIIMGPWMSMAIKARKTVNIMEYFFEKNVITGLTTGSIKETIMELSVQAGEWTGLDHNYIYKKVIEKENLNSSAINKCISVPHSRIPDLSNPVIIVGQHRNGVEWDSSDGKRVKLIFLILIPESNELDYNYIHIQILKNIASLSTNQPLLEKAKIEEDSEKLYDLIESEFKGRYLDLRNKKTS